MLFLPTLGFLEVLLVVAFPFLIDLDFLLSKYAKHRNHRRLITHSLLPYVILLILGIFFPIILILGICGVIHILTDAIDWGTALLNPFYDEPLGGVLPKPPKEVIDIPDYRRRQCWFTKTYYQSKILLGLEVIFGGIAIVLIIINDIAYLWILIFYFTFITMQILAYSRCTSPENKKE